MYDFILIQYQLGRLTDAQVDRFAAKGFITAEEATAIKASKTQE